MYGEGPTPAAAIDALRSKVEAHGGRLDCDSLGVCYTVDANGARFRIHVTPLATTKGVKYYSATQGLAI
jgi:hypothetical protein